MKRREMNRIEDEKKRMMFLTFFFGIMVGIFVNFSFFKFYQLPKSQKQQNRIILSYETLLKDKETKIKKISKQLEKQKKMPRMTFGHKKIKTSLPNLATDMEKELKNEGFIGTALIVKNNEIVLERGYGYANKELEVTNDSNTTYMIGSIQKAVTAVMIMKLIEENRLTLNTTLDNYYPEIKESKKITIRQLLDMTSGLNGKIDGRGTEKEIIHSLVENTTFNAPVEWRYTAENYTLLSGIIREITKGNYQKYVTSNLIEKLNLNHTGFYDTFEVNQESSVSYAPKKKPYEKIEEVSLNQYQKEVGTGNMYMSVGDMATFYQELADGKIISKESLNSLRTVGKMDFHSTYAGGNYIKKDYLTSHGVLGGYESYLAMTFDGSTGIILFSNQQAGKINIPAMAEHLYKQLIK